jgi:hypothetical protein
MQISQIIKKNFYYQIYFLMGIFTFLLIPFIANANVFITEIMYDPEGADTGREWVEFYNSNDFDIDLTKYRFLENNVNHKISGHGLVNFPVVTNILPVKSYAVIADNPAKFLIDNPDYEGFLFKSSFSLNNTGEFLAITDHAGVVIDSVDYLAEWGAKNTGNTLQLHDGFWIPAIKTPGRENATMAIDESKKTDNKDAVVETNIGSTHSNQTDITNFSPKNKLEIGVGRDRFVTINSPVYFQALINDEFKRSDFIWNLGNGDVMRGRDIKYFYDFAGVYNVVLNSKSDNQQATARNKVHVLEPKISFKLINRGKHVDIMLINDSDFEVNFGEFYFIYQFLAEKTQKNNQKIYKIPIDTIVSAKSNLVLKGEIINLPISEQFNIEFYYPNDLLIESFSSIEQTLNNLGIFIKNEHRLEFSQIVAERK